MMPQQKPAVTDCKIESATLESVIEIRHKVLRHDQPRNTCYYPEDTFKNTCHYVAKLHNEVIGCASVYKETHPDLSLKKCWRIRGMAVLDLFQNQGYGLQLLTACINHAIDQKADVIWCNARTNAVAFYKKSGFKVIGDEFDIENIGPHFLLAKNLGIHHSPFKFLQIAKQIFRQKPPAVVPQSKQKS